MCHISKLSPFWHVSEQCLIARKMEVLTVTNNTTESGEERSIFSIILESTCPENCSGNGHCIDGKFSFCWCKLGIASLHDKLSIAYLRDKFGIAYICEISGIA
jgi:hypothetical protein